MAHLIVLMDLMKGQLIAVSHYAVLMDAFSACPAQKGLVSGQA